MHKWPCCAPKQNSKRSCNIVVNTCVYLFFPNRIYHHIFVISMEAQNMYVAQWARKLKKLMQNGWCKVILQIGTHYSHKYIPTKNILLIPLIPIFLQDFFSSIYIPMCVEIEKKVKSRRFF